MSSRTLTTVLIAMILLACVPCAEAATVQARSASSEAAFALGTMDGTALDEDGRIHLAPAMDTIWGPEEGIVWAVQPSGDEGAFVALSGPGRILRVAPGSEPEMLYVRAEDSLVTAMISDGDLGVVAGISPDGHILHLDGRGGEPMLTLTGATFIWALARAEDGTLYAGTGLPGQLLRMRRGGEPETLFETGEDPVRCVALESDGSLVIGTGGRGKVIRISEQGRPFVLLDAEEAEIVSLASGPDGSIYALAADGSKRPSSPRPKGAERLPLEAPAVEITVRPPAEERDEQEAPEEMPPAPAKAQPGRFKAKAGGVLYRLDPDGSIRRIWETASEIPFALAVTEAGDILVATGDEGGIWMLDGEGRSSKLLRIPSRQASSLAHGEGGRLLVGGTTDARVVLLGPGPRAEGSYITSTVDAGGVADWGRLRWDAELPGGTKLAVKVRAGNTAEADETWSEWRTLGEGAGPAGIETDLPATRWFQARFDLSSRHERSPLLSRVEIFFQPRNRPPEVTQLNVERPGIAWVRGPVQSSARRGPVVADDPVTRQVTATLMRNSKAGNVIRRSFEQGARTFSWKAGDPDGDRLRYKLELRREGSEDWFPLVQDLENSFYSWDARAWQNGHYRVRLTADDSRDNPAGDQRGDSRISEAFLIDNSRPALDDMKVARSGGDCLVKFLALDPGGSIVSAEAALDGGEWKPLAPLDGVADSARESFEVACSGENERDARTIMVRVIDAAGNMGGRMWVIPDR